MQRSCFQSSAADAFIDLYPLLPYQIDLIIQVVSGLRTQGGASKHVGGANRTIIKLAQQLLIHPEVALGDQEIGQLARLDQIYDLVQSNIASEVRGKINQIAKQLDHPMAQPVAKVICLLQFVKSVHRTAENIAAALYPALGAPSVLEQVKEALRALEDAQLVRTGDDGYRIPTPAEDDWERTRNATSPKPSDVKRLHREVLAGFWNPQPTYTLLDVKPFKAGLSIDGREEVKGDSGYPYGASRGGRGVLSPSAGTPDAKSVGAGRRSIGQCHSVTRSIMRASSCFARARWSHEKGARPEPRPRRR